MKESDKTMKVVENPYAAVFDLADEVSQKTPPIMKLFGIAVILGLSMAAFFGLSFIILSFYETGYAYCYLPLGLVFLIIGVILVWPFMKWMELFKFFMYRFDAIKAVRYSDPIVPVPQGNTLTERYLSHLRYSSQRLQWFLRNNPHALQIKSGSPSQTSYFDAHIQKKPGLIWQWFGVGDPGYGFYIKSFNHIPSIDEIRVLEGQVKGISKHFSIPPSRAVALFKMRVESSEIDGPVYDYIINYPIIVKLKQRTYKCPIQAVIEMEDNTYDFIPIIPTIPSELP